MNEKYSSTTQRDIAQYINHLEDTTERTYTAALQISLFDKPRGAQIMRCYKLMTVMLKHLHWIHFKVKESDLAGQK